MTALPPELREQCEDGIRSIYASDPAKAQAELARFRLICSLDERPEQGSDAANILDAVKETSVWRWLTTSTSRAALQATGKIRPRPHAFANVDVKLLDGSWRTLRLPIRLDETTVSGETQIVEYRLRSIEACRP